MAKTFIIDDHPVARLAIRILLEKDKHVVVGETDDGHKAVLMVCQLEPDIVIVDLDILSLSGIEVIEKLRASKFKGGLLVLTSRHDEHYLSRCISIGADGFISKRNNIEELSDAVKAVLRGYGYFPINRKNGDCLRHPAHETESLKLLSTRELQVLRYLAQGMKVIDISLRMHISNKTVSTYKTRIMIKLELDSNMALIDFARRNNLD